MSGNIGWDDEIVLRKRSDHAKVTRSSSDINAARRAGAVVSTERKVVTNAGHVGEDFRRIAKLAETDEIIAPKAISMDVGKAIAKARMEKKLSQKELGVLVNEKQTVVSYPFCIVVCICCSLSLGSCCCPLVHRDSVKFFRDEVSNDVLFFFLVIIERIDQRL